MNQRFADEAFKARAIAGLTRERAAEILDISPRTLSYYESGRKIPDEIVAGMVRAYKSPALGYRFLSSELGTGRMILPQIERVGISSSALRLHVVMKRAEALEEDLDNICWDDRITAEEEETFRACMKRVMELAGACIGMTLIHAKSPAPEATGTGLRIRKAK